MPVIETPARAALPIPDRAVEDEDQDRLDFGEIAAALTAILDAPELDTPTVVALHGPWGSGKTSLVNLVTNGLLSRRSNHRHQFLYFDAWQNDVGSEGSGPLLREAAFTLDQSRGTIANYVSSLPGRLLPWHKRVKRFFARILVALVLAAFVIVAYTAITGNPVPDIPLDLPGSGEGISPLWASVLIGGAYHVARMTVDVVPSLSRYVKNRSKIASKEDLEQVREDFDRLVNRTIGTGSSRFYIIIDNLDRCGSGTSLDILDAVKKVLDVPMSLSFFPWMSACWSNSWGRDSLPNTT